MSGPSPIPPFSVITGTDVQRVLTGDEQAVTAVVERAYRTHGAGDTVNPPSYFLRFPDRPASRIIALPASLGGESGVDGLKWIGSFPENVRDGIPRASAVLILNDPRTGYPYAAMEASIISASRTAASAALAAGWLTRDRGRPPRVGFFGTGLIARYIHTYLAANGWEFAEIGLHDLSATSVDGFSGYLARTGTRAEVVRHDRAETLIRSADLVVFATVAGTPHVTDPAWFAHNPVVLHVSLRDLSPEIVLASTNVVDDVEHCLKADTSVHLAEQQTGHRDFVHGTLFDVMTGTVALPADRPLVFSPFGLGVLDLAVGRHVHDRLAADGGLTPIPGFFADVTRYG
ncbi:2,3-diaminopropionate biosynthesis protein SbnB [Amycolatopsis kentuckyensis]|uniref:2,3-diaminopropionate biosynthesis protein SbnB n=1 Tax=Amycolatopsis kentuckyensis TaxID=218823 RepID=UPI000A38F06E|nr:2,3-diaminopropionate biosynthesis protein SbnB [Amycolatopsis kentuckyensis]